MLQSAELIVIYVGQCSKLEFLEDIQLQDSVIRRILVIAEAARRISEPTRQSLPQISWQEINGMRNRLVHGYDDINIDIVWNVVQSEIPPLIEELKLHIPPEN
ncbi:MAG: HepT-like ribonuclease domain-containing protein [Nodosilinea sp.]